MGTKPVAWLERSRQCVLEHRPNVRPGGRVGAQESAFDERTAKLSASFVAKGTHPAAPFPLLFLIVSGTCQRQAGQQTGRGHDSSRQGYAGENMRVV